MTACGVYTNVGIEDKTAPQYVLGKEVNSKYVKEQGNEPVLRTCILEKGHFKGHQAEDGTRWGGYQFEDGKSYVFSAKKGWQPAKK